MLQIKGPFSIFTISYKDIFNFSADGNYEVVWQPNVLLHHDGSILWMSPAIYESSCAIDVEYFPFDEQECEMKFGSWAFDASRVGLMSFYSLKYQSLMELISRLSGREYNEKCK